MPCPVKRGPCLQGFSSKVRSSPELAGFSDRILSGCVYNYLNMRIFRFSSFYHELYSFSADRFFSYFMG